MFSHEIFLKASTTSGLCMHKLAEETQINFHTEIFSNEKKLVQSVSDPENLGEKGEEET